MELTSCSREEALDKIDDTPATLEFRALALDPTTKVYRSGGGFMLLDRRATLLGVYGDVVADEVIRLKEVRVLQCEVLADRRAVAALSDGWNFTRSVILSRASDWPAAPAIEKADDTRPLTPGDPLNHLPQPMRIEIEEQRAVRDVVAAFVDNRPVSFAYAPWETETLSDIAVSTLETHRRSGMAWQAANELLRRLEKQPVWGTPEDNVASLALARRLGFTQPGGELYVQL